MVNTNGFIGEWMHASDNLNALKKELADLSAELQPIYDELNALRTKYAVAEKEVKKVSLTTQIKDAKRRTEYYYFRSIIDGIYNLLKTYGWQHQHELFTHLRNFGIKCTFCDYDFEVYYVDDLCDLTPQNAYFGREYVDIDEEYLIYGEIDTCDEIKLPVGLNIEKVLNEAEAFLKDSVELMNKKEEDEEYKTYLRLKEKYEGK